MNDRGFTFANLLVKADEVTLQALLGKPAIRLLQLLDSQLVRTRRLRELLTQLYPPAELLRSQQQRRILFELLPKDVAAELVERLDVDADSEPYRALNALKVKTDSPRELRLFEFFDVEPPEPAQLDEVPVETLVEPGYGLFPHQRRAALETARALRQEPHRVLLHMPTGAGKTRTTMHVIAEHLLRFEPTLVVWLAYSEELCEQAASEFEIAWKHLGNRPITCYRFWGPRDLDLETSRDGLVVAGLGKVFNSAKKSMDFIFRMADQTSLVVIDEAHQAVAETYSLVLDVLCEQKPSTGLLGLTATPGRTWSDVTEDEELSRFFARRKVGLATPGYENAVDYLIAEGYLADPTFVPLTYSGGLKLTARDEADLAGSLDIPAAILRRLADDEKRNLLIVQKTEELLRHHERVLVFATTVQHARLLATVLASRGADANAITAQTDTAERRRIITHFKSSSPEPRALCNFGVLTTGFDAPRTNAAVIARPTKSLVLYFQMVGRVIRGPKQGGSKTAEVLTVVDLGLPGFRDVGEAFMNWEDVWQTNK